MQARACDHDNARMRRPDLEHVRIDRWLWAARFFKTRAAATDAVAGGHVHLNGVRVKPAKEVRAGDMLEITAASSRREVVVLGVADRRGPATVAATLYEETPESAARREQHALERRMTRPLGADLGPRPTKRDRRRLDALRAQLRSRRT
jgi:ribosome-associated heat shock protein Hsp15